MNLDRFDARDIAVVTDWIYLISELLPDPEWEGRIRTGLQSLATKAQEIWPAYLAGEPVELRGADLDPSWDGVDGDIILSFVAPTGYLLLNGQDSPTVTAVAMREAIDFLLAHAECKEG